MNDSVAYNGDSEMFGGSVTDIDIKSGARLAAAPAAEIANGSIGERANHAATHRPANGQDSGRGR